MKDMDSTAVGRAPEPEPERDGFTSRKLIRPSLARAEEIRSHQNAVERRERVERAERNGVVTGTKKLAPPEQTHAENFYYQKQIQAKTSMVVVLQSGEELHGVIEWYDRSCIKLHRSGAPNLLVLKHNVKYMYKENESDEADEESVDADDEAE